MIRLTNNKLGIILLSIGTVLGLFAAMVARPFILFSCIVFAIGIIFFVMSNEKKANNDNETTEKGGSNAQI